MLWYMAFIDRVNMGLWIERAEEAERSQLNAFLPHMSFEKQLVMARMRKLVGKPFVCGPRRQQLIRDFREEQAEVNSMFASFDRPSRCKRKFFDDACAVDLADYPVPHVVGCRELCLMDFVPATNWTHTNCFIDVTIVSRVSTTNVWNGAVRMIVEDKEKDVLMMLVHGAHEAEKTSRCFRRGVTLRIKNPMQRVSQGGRCVLRVDLCSTLIEAHSLYGSLEVNPSEFGILKTSLLCFYCCDQIDADGCIWCCCSVASYCSAKCQDADQMLMSESKLICHLCEDAILCTRYTSTVVEDYDCCPECYSPELDETLCFEKKTYLNH